LPEHQPDDFGASGTERHAYADLPCPLTHDVRDDAVYTDGSEEQCQHREECDEHEIKTRTRKLRIYEFRH
jgi:hypothetical protein